MDRPSELWKKMYLFQELNQTSLFIELRQLFIFGGGESRVRLIFWGRRTSVLQC